MYTSKVFSSISLILIVSAHCTCAWADDDVLGSDADPVKFGKWFDSLKKALKKDDKAAIAKMIDSPLPVNYGGDFDSYTGKTSKAFTRNFNQSAFLNNYDKIFTHDLKKRIIISKNSDLWGNSHGICFAQGVMWIDPQDSGKVYKIKSINAGVAPPDTDAIAQKVHDAEKSTPTDSVKIASLYSALANGYDQSWRVLGQERESEVPELKKKEEMAYKKAISLRQGAAAKSPDQAKDLKQLAVLLAIDKGREAEVEQLYEQAYVLQKVVLPPTSLPLLKSMRDLESRYEKSGDKAKWLAILSEHLASGKLVVAKMESEHAGGRGSDLAEAYEELGRINLGLGKDADARTALDKSYQLWKVKKDQMFALYLAPLLAQAARVTEAKSVLSSISDTGNHNSCTVQVATGLAKNGKSKDADALLVPYIESLKSSQYGEGLAPIVDVYIAGHDLPKALQIADDAVSMNEGEPETWEAKGKVQALMGNKSGAQESYVRAIKEFRNSDPKDPTLFEPLKALTIIYVQEKKFPDAEKTANKALGVLPKLGGNYGDMLGLLATIYDAESQPAKAEPLYKQAIEIKTKEEGPDDKSVLNLKKSYAEFQQKNHK
jgi:tetratricopeptide (TPR) repeat protein